MAVDGVVLAFEQVARMEMNTVPLLAFSADRLALDASQLDERIQHELSSNRYGQLRRRDVATALGLHESTVSRAVKDRTAELPDGRVVPLATMFGSGHDVRPAVARLLATGQKCSDQRRSEMLRAQGIFAARRTVAKYRREMQGDGCLLSGRGWCCGRGFGGFTTSTAPKVIKRAQMPGRWVRVVPRERSWRLSSVSYGQANRSWRARSVT